MFIDAENDGRISLRDLSCGVVRYLQKPSDAARGERAGREESANVVLMDERLSSITVTSDSCVVTAHASKLFTRYGIDFGRVGRVGA
ncbi:hypothetical protein [Methylogaea oryzae]|uniref:Uncharacterized protein n=1 Tax=Methylogaea oryzae TaxID=1295382 RepID=A0A8D5AJW6_9GAMM|nr:hypothetical protein [Methylogaea oryzae]BBL70486.1 hypothetical protein MoryE10_10920 [Methylogaea oryzae]